MEQHLRQAPWFTGSEYGIADIALFAYTDVAGEGGIDLAPFPEVRAWLQRVRGQPRFLPMPAVTAEGAHASTGAGPRPAERNNDSRPHARAQPRRRVRRQFPRCGTWLARYPTPAAGTELILLAARLHRRARPTDSQLASRQLDLMARVLRAEQGLLHHRLLRP